MPRSTATKSSPIRVKAKKKAINTLSRSNRTTRNASTESPDDQETDTASTSQCNRELTVSDTQSHDLSSAQSDSQTTNPVQPRSDLDFLVSVIHTSNTTPHDQEQVTEDAAPMRQPTENANSHQPTDEKTRHQQAEEVDLTKPTDTTVESPQPTEEYKPPVLHITGHTTKPDNPLFINSLIKRYDLNIRIEETRFTFRTKTTMIRFTTEQDMQTFVRELESTTFGSNAKYGFPDHRPRRQVTKQQTSTETCVVKNVARDIAEQDFVDAINEDPRLCVTRASRIVTNAGKSMFLRLYGDLETITSLLREGVSICGRRYPVEPSRTQERHHPCRRCLQYNHDQNSCYAAPKCHICGNNCITNRCDHRAMRDRNGVFTRRLYCGTCDDVGSHFTGQLGCPRYPGMGPVPVLTRPIVYLASTPPAPPVAPAVPAAVLQHEATLPQTEQATITLSIAELTDMMENIAAKAAQRAVDAMTLVFFNMVPSDNTEKLKHVINAATKEVFKQRTVIAVNSHNRLNILHSDTKRQPSSYATALQTPNSNKQATQEGKQLNCSSYRQCDASSQVHAGPSLQEHPYNASIGHNANTSNYRWRKPHLNSNNSLSIQHE